VRTPFSAFAAEFASFGRLLHGLVVYLMPPKKTPNCWGDDEKAAIIKGFREHGWDPEETSGVKIKAAVKSVPELFAILKPFFGINDGGTKTNNNQFYDHFKAVGCEFIVARTRDGFRRQSGASGAFGSVDRSASLFSCCSRSAALSFFFQLPTSKTKD